MKKLLALLLALAMIACLFVGCAGDDTKEPSDDSKEPASSADESKSEEPSSEEPTGETYKIAMITDYGDITDQSFNQTTYEACKKFSDENGVDFKYYKPTDNTTAARVASIDQAIEEGYNLIVMPGYAFGAAIVEAAPQNPDTKFFALDVGKGDMLETAVANKGETYNWDPDSYDFDKYVDMSNVYCVVYQEELCGYMAGYAAVKLGYTKLGFLGGMAVPAVQRYGHGFVQGVDAAAKDSDIKVELKYVYGGQFQGDADITAVMDTWYAGGTEVVFACGGGIFTSAAEAAKKVNGKVIGVDVDQAGIIDGGYGEGMTVTSAMKGLAPATIDTLTDIVVNGNWSKYVGKIATLGLVSGDDPELNYVQIPMESTQWEDGKFTKDDYKALVKDMFDGKIKVSNDVSKLPDVTNVTIDDQGKIKG